jgi:hypothetical protein
VAAGISSLGRDFGTFIRGHNGQNLSRSGLSVTDLTKRNGELAGMVRATTQFVGAARGGWGSQRTNVFIGTPELAKQYGMPTFPGPAQTKNFANRAMTDEMWINANWAGYLGKAGNAGRVVIHEDLHPRMGSEFADGWPHKRLDYQARGLLKSYGLGDGGCDAVGGFLGLFEAFPGC